MANYNCAESQTRICKAYIADCYGHLATSFNSCKSAERQALKNNVFSMLDRIKTLLDNKPLNDDTNSANEAENE